MKPRAQHLFAPHIKGRDETKMLRLQAGDRAAYLEALDFKGNNPDASGAEIAQHLLATVWAGVDGKNEKQAEASVRRWQRSKFWRAYLRVNAKQP